MTKAKRASRPKRPPKRVKAAPKPYELDHLSASISVGSALLIRVHDFRTLKPVVGTFIQSVDVKPSYGESETSLQFEYGFDLPDEPPPYAKPYTAFHEKILQEEYQKIKKADADLEKLGEECSKLVGDLEAATTKLAEIEADVKKKFDEKQEKRPAKRRRRWNKNKHVWTKEYNAQFVFHRKIARALKAHNNKIRATERARRQAMTKVEAKVRHRRERSNWIIALKLMLVLHAAWTDEVDAKADDLIFKQFGKGYKQTFGKTPNWKRFRRWVDELYQHIPDGYYKTTKKGEILVALPPGETGKVRIEFAHIKVTHPDDYAILVPEQRSVIRRAEYDSSKEGNDDPGSRAEISAWSVVAPQGNDKVTASFRNWIELDFDTTSVLEGSYAVDTHNVLAMVWCQPAWTEVESKHYLMEPGGSIHDGRGEKNGHPTLLISSIPAMRLGSGKDYGFTVVHAHEAAQTTKA